MRFLYIHLNNDYSNNFGTFIQLNHKSLQISIWVKKERARIRTSDVLAEATNGLATEQ